jgi:NAD(P)H-dependent FMN reductase
MLKIAVILGSTRPKRFGEKPARWIFDELKKRKGVEAVFLDLRDYPMPFFDMPASPAWTQGEYGTDAVTAWRKQIADADGFIIVSPEYNRGYSAVLKNAIDFLYNEWNDKPVGFVAYGSVGGARVVEQLRLVAVELQMMPVRHGVHLPVDLYLSMMNDEAPVDAERFKPVQQAADKMLDQLVFWAGAMKTAREKAQREAAQKAA